MAKKADINIENFNVVYNINVENFEDDDERDFEDALPFIRMHEAEKSLFSKGKRLCTWIDLDDLEQQLAMLNVGDELCLMEVDKRGELKQFDLMRFTVACKERTDPDCCDGVLDFVADSVMFEHPMHDKGIYVSRFEDTALFAYLNNEFKSKLNKDIRSLLVGDIYVPTAAQVFGQDDEWANNHYDMSSDLAGRWPLMSRRKERIAVDQDDDLVEWWLSTPSKDPENPECFGMVTDAGYAFLNGTSANAGVRPAFSLRYSL